MEVLRRPKFVLSVILCTIVSFLASCSPSEAESLDETSQTAQNSDDLNAGDTGATSKNQNTGPSANDQPSNTAESSEAESTPSTAETSVPEEATPTTGSDLSQILDPPSANQSQPLETHLSFEFLSLDDIASIWLPHMHWAVSIQLLDQTTNAELAAPISLNQDSTFISASAAKTFWITAVAAELGTESVEHLVFDVLCLSDNVQTAELIKLIGIDSINEFLHNQAGMTNTFLLRWTFGEEPPDPASQEWASKTRYTSNRTTVLDSARFYSQLYLGELLPQPETEVVLGWLEDFARCRGPLAYPLALRLPTETQVLHKAGWLPPMCCQAETATLNDFGIVLTPEATYSIAIATQGGEVSDETFAQQQNFISYASCRILAVVTAEPTSCQRNQDSSTRVLDLETPESEQSQTTATTG